MSSEKWFDWDTDKPEASPAETQPEATSAPAPDFPALDSAEPQLGQEGLHEPGPVSEPPPTAATSAAIEDSFALPTESEPAKAALAIPAQRPFTLWIEGRFTDEDRDRILELLSRENFGIREVDLEPQWETGRVLVPQISEFAAMRVAQTLRESSLNLTLLPVSGAAPAVSHGVPIKPPASASTGHPADQIVVSALDLPHPQDQSGDWETVDTLVATGLLKEPEWKASQSDTYSRLVESLKRELRYRAHIKKADALVRFKAEVLASPFQTENECRVQVSALALRKRVR